MNDSDIMINESEKTQRIKFKRDVFNGEDLFNDNDILTRSEKYIVEFVKNITEQTNYLNSIMSLISVISNEQLTPECMKDISEVLAQHNIDSQKLNINTKPSDFKGEITEDNKEIVTKINECRKLFNYRDQLSSKLKITKNTCNLHVSDLFKVCSKVLFKYKEIEANSETNDSKPKPKPKKDFKKKPYNNFKSKGKTVSTFN